jgi:hypothetical protein
MTYSYPLEVVKRWSDERRQLEARVAELETVLAAIRAEQGRVCETFTECDHAACRSSYMSWALADQALARPVLSDDGDHDE